ncbi:MAG: hypothetical protein V4474_01090 [Patescibacteria group bacterium]
MVEFNPDFIDIALRNARADFRTQRDPDPIKILRTAAHKCIGFGIGPKQRRAIAKAAISRLVSEGLKTPPSG